MTTPLRIAMGSDHRGDAAVKHLADVLRHAGHAVQLMGECNGESCDYPDPAFEVGHAVSRGDADRGILVCGSGIGMSIAANKVARVRAVLAHDQIAAEMSRRHNDANVLCMSADRTSLEDLEKITATWLATEFEGGRHQRRVDKIHENEQGSQPVG